MNDFDAIVIGTGFGGAVAACRLVEAKKKICVLERGRRYESQPPGEAEVPWSDFPELPSSNDAFPDPKRWRWGDDQGLWDLRNLREILSVQTAGYGGGSLTYANVHLRAPKDVFDSWPFTRVELDRYYDLVAYMLNVKPITEAPFAPPEKTSQFQKAAEDGLGRTEGFFYPPMAVNFDGGNAFGAEQSKCNACGECLTGCRYRAKNTLDLNYLAIVDDCALADVRTQAEATLIAAKAGSYDVTYRDHLRGGESRVVSADQVFVCAGAINTTELLLRSKAEKALPNLNAEALGTRYFPNADFPAMIYDARTPGNEPRLLDPTEGPTITACLYHEGPPGEEAQRRWFLLEEGGFPIEIARHMGVFRAPALLRRNRHDDRELRKHEIQPVPGWPSQPNPEVPSKDAPPLLRSLADGLYAILGNESEILNKVAPEQLQEALREFEAQFDGFRRENLLKVVSGVRRKIRQRGWLKIVPDCLIPPAEEMLEDVNEALRDEFGLGDTAREHVELATKLASWLLRFDDTGGAHSLNSMVLLAMGVDAAGGRITWEKNDHPGNKGTLRVKMDSSSEPPLSTLEECLMRDIACALGGKLRLNPLWSFAQTPVTVHSQGGCPMSGDPEKGVTDEAGQVRGHPGLFVMDAASFPSSIGVNPSATIAAVAERNMARLLGEPSRHMAEAARWWSEQSWKDHEKVALEPPRVGRSDATVNQPVGIEFSEKMSGFHYRDPIPDEDDEISYRAAEAAGRNLGQALSIQLTATIEDVAAFIHSKDHAVPVAGDVTLTWEDEKFEKATFETVGTLCLFGSDDAAGERRMHYQLDFGGPSRHDSDFELSGYKRIRNDPGADAWRDTSSLFTQLRGRRSRRRSYGVIHVPLDGFLFDQLPSFRVTNTADPARITWALASFGSYFFGHLQRIYVPQLETVIEGFADLEIR